MKKKILFLMFFCLFALQARNTFAAFDKFYTTGSNGSTVEKNDFSANETPYLYVKLPHSGTNFTVTAWNSPSSLTYFTFDGPGVFQELWIKLPNWTSIVELGEWTINGQYLYAGAPLDGGQATYKFSVSPEPISSGLFLAGGLALIARSRRKKLQQA